MGLPASYARLAGVQSEVNKITVTRVAGNEVQFRRTLDTYRRALRYEVDQIGRQQKELKRCMRRYSRTLHQAKRERIHRQRKAQEDEQRHKRQAKDFRQAELAVRRQVFNLEQVQGQVVESGQQQQPPPQGESGDVLQVENVQESQQRLQQGSQNIQHQQHENSQDPPQPQQHPQKHPHQHPGKHPPQHSQKHPHQHSHQAKPTQRSKQPSPSQHSLQQQPHETPPREADQSAAAASRDRDPLPSLPTWKEGEAEHRAKLSEPRGNAADSDNLLPAIQEGREDDCVKGNQSLTHTADNKAAPSAENKQKDAGKDCQGAKPFSLSSLVTRLASNPSDLQQTSLKEEGEADQRAPPKMSFASVATAVLVSRKAAKRDREGVGRGMTLSLGDLVRLQHVRTSNPKRLFRMVDRLAARHAIPDIPQHQREGHPSKDPRHNAKIKERGAKPESSLSSGMAKQGGVLYAMMHGYHVHNDPDSPQQTEEALHSKERGDESETSLSSGMAKQGEVMHTMKPGYHAHKDRPQPVMLPSLFQAHPGSSGNLPSLFQAHPGSSGNLPSLFETGPEGGVSLANLRPLTDDKGGRFPGDLSPRLIVEEDRSPTAQRRSPLLEPASPDVTQDLSARLRGRRGSHKQPISMLELSEHATWAREQTLLVPTALEEKEGGRAESSLLSPSSRRGSDAITDLSPLPAGLLRRARKATVASQLQERLSEGTDSEGPRNSWQTAFGRLKVLHTLKDLSHHFTKDS